MNNRQAKIRFFAFLIAIVFFYFSSSSGFAQTFVSGSTGADGALSPVSDINLLLPPDGVFNYTTVNIPAGVTVSYTPNSANTPVTILATGDINIDGTINVNGEHGVSNADPIITLNKGKRGGPGGFSGGSGGLKGTATSGSVGQGPGGSPLAGNGTYGAPTNFVTLIPLFGGSGGAGGNGGGNAGPSGGGGGGAIVLASSTNIIVNGSIGAFGGNGWTPGQFVCDSRRSTPGSGGAIRLVAPQISGSGLLNAAGGIPASSGCPIGSPGRTRLEAYTQAFTGFATNSSLSTPGPVNAASDPALTNLPTLSVSSIGGITVPSIPAGSYETADISFPTGTVNPVSMTLTMTNIPVGTIFTVRIIPRFISPTSSISTPSAGTFSNTTATALLTLPLGQVSVLNAYANFSIPSQIAALFPTIDGEALERIMLATNMGQASRLILMTKSGKEIPAKALLGKEELALLWMQVQAQK